MYVLQGKSHTGLAFVVFFSLGRLQKATLEQKHRVVRRQSSEGGERALSNLSGSEDDDDHPGLLLGSSNFASTATPSLSAFKRRTPSQTISRKSSAAGVNAAGASLPKSILPPLLADPGKDFLSSPQTKPLKASQEKEKAKAKEKAKVAAASAPKTQEKQKESFDEGTEELETGSVAKSSETNIINTHPLPLAEQGTALQPKPGTEQSSPKLPGLMSNSRLGVVQLGLLQQELVYPNFPVPGFMQAQSQLNFNLPFTTPAGPSLLGSLASTSLPSFSHLPALQPREVQLPSFPFSGFPPQYSRPPSGEIWSLLSPTPSVLTSPRPTPTPIAPFHINSPSQSPVAREKPKSREKTPTLSDGEGEGDDDDGDDDHDVGSSAGLGEGKQKPIKLSRKLSASSVPDGKLILVVLVFRRRDTSFFMS